MPFIVVPFLIKGLVIATKAVIASKKVTVAAKAITAASHTYGTATVVATTASAATVIGGIAWSTDRIGDLKTCYAHWKSGDMVEFTRSVASLASKVNAVANNSFVESAVAVLIKHGYTQGELVRFAKELLDQLSEITREAERPPLS